jgi:hypothetical protein
VVIYLDVIHIAIVCGAWGARDLHTRAPVRLDQSVGSERSNCLVLYSKTPAHDDDKPPACASDNDGESSRFIGKKPKYRAYTPSEEPFALEQEVIHLIAGAPYRAKVNEVYHVEDGRTWYVVVHADDNRCEEVGHHDLRPSWWRRDELQMNEREREQHESGFSDNSRRMAFGFRPRKSVSDAERKQQEDASFDAHFDAARALRQKVNGEREEQEEARRELIQKKADEEARRQLQQAEEKAVMEQVDNKSIITVAPEEETVHIRRVDGTTATVRIDPNVPVEELVEQFDRVHGEVVIRQGTHLSMAKGALDPRKSIIENGYAGTYTD